VQHQGRGWLSDREVGGRSRLPAEQACKDNQSDREARTQS